MRSVELEWNKESETFLEYTFPNGKKLDIQTGRTVKEPI